MSNARRLVDRMFESPAVEVPWDLSSVENNPLERQLSVLLTIAGIPASYEYPGYVAINTKRGQLNIGTANGEWGMDLIDAQGQNIVDQAGAPYDAWLSNTSKRDPQEVSPVELIEYILPIVAWGNLK
jgi:hypothetical protein